MQYLDFYENGPKVSKVVLGCMHFPELKVSEIANLIDASYEHGINLLDIADCYTMGKAESLLGEALKISHTRRDSLFIQSKCGILKEEGKPTIYDFSKKHILEACDASLKRLGTDHLDCLLLHRPDALMEPQEISEAFLVLKNSGKVLSFGVSNMNPLQMELLKSELEVPLVLNQLQLSVCHTPMIDSGFNVNMYNEASVLRDGGTLEYLRLHKMVIQAWSVMQYGFFDGVFLNNPKFPLLNDKLEELSHKYETNTTAVAIAFVLRYPGLMQAIIGTTKIDRVIDSAKACDFELSRRDWYELYLSAGNLLP